MYAAILHLSFPVARHAEVSRFLAEEMLAVIRDNEGFVDFRVLDAAAPGRRPAAMRDGIALRSKDLPPR